MRRIVAIIAMALWAGSAWAEEAASPAPTRSPYPEAIEDGNRLYRSGDHEGALRAYRRALESGENEAMATFFVATAQRATGDLDGALASFRRTVTLAEGDNLAYRARALWNVAMILEARRDFTAAREAYRAYIAFAESQPGVITYAANARQRLDAITAVEELDATYEAVRERIRSRAASHPDE